MRNSHHVIEDQSFQNLFPSQLPSIEKFENKFHETFLAVQSKIKMIIRFSSYYSLSQDELTRFNYNFIGISIIINDNYYLLCLNAPDDLSRSSEVISRVFNEILNNYKLDRNKIVSTCTDCASAVRKSIKISNVFWTPCCAHMINRAFLEWVKSDEILQNILNKLNLLSNSYQFKTFLILHESKFKVLPSFTEIRWLPLFNTINRAVSLKENI